MSTLSPVDPKTDYFDLEPIICDADNMVDVLFMLIDEVFSERANANQQYVMHENTGSRIFYVAGLVQSMSAKVREAYYVAHENDRKANPPGK